MPCAALPRIDLDHLLHKCYVAPTLLLAHRCTPLLRTPGWTASAREFRSKHGAPHCSGGPRSGCCSRPQRPLHAAEGCGRPAALRHQNHTRQSSQPRHGWRGQVCRIGNGPCGMQTGWSASEIPLRRMPEGSGPAPRGLDHIRAGTLKSSSAGRGRGRCILPGHAARLLYGAEPGEHGP